MGVLKGQAGQGGEPCGAGGLWLPKVLPCARAECSPTATAGPSREAGGCWLRSWLGARTGSTLWPWPSRGDEKSDHSSALSKWAAPVQQPTAGTPGPGDGPKASGQQESAALGQQGAPERRGGTRGHLAVRDHGPLPECGFTLVTSDLSTTTPPVRTGGSLGSAWDPVSPALALALEQPLHTACRAAPAGRPMPRAPAAGPLSRAPQPRALP